MKIHPLFFFLLLLSLFSLLTPPAQAQLFWDEPVSAVKRFWPELSEKELDYYQKLQNAWKEERWEDVMTLNDQYHAEFPKNPYVLIQLLMIYTTKKLDLPKAEGYWKELNALDPYLGEMYKAYLSFGDMDATDALLKALNYFRDVFQNHGEKYDLHYLNVYYAFKEIGIISSHEVEGILQRNAWRYAGDPKSFYYVNLYTKLIAERRENEPELKSAKQDIALILGTHPDTATAEEKAAMWKEFQVKDHELSRLGKNVDMEFLQRAIDIDPYNPRYWKDMVFQFWNKTDENGMSLDYKCQYFYRKAALLIDHMPANEREPFLYNVYCGIADLADTSFEDFTTGEEYLQKALAIQNRPEYMTHYAEVLWAEHLMKMKKYDESIAKMYELIKIKLDPMSQLTFQKYLIKMRPILEAKGIVQ